MINDAKEELVRRFYKEEDTDITKNYWPIGISSGFSKVYEIFMHSNLTNFTKSVFSRIIL